MSQVLPELFYIYLASGVFFLLIEMLTATFYGLSVGLACFILAVYVYVTKDPSVTIIQGVVLAIASLVFAYFLPKWLKPHGEALKSWLDAHIGQSFRLERVGSDWKVKIDGVDYLVSDDSETPDFKSGKKVRLDGHDGAVLRVSVLQ